MTVGDIRSLLYPWAARGRPNVFHYALWTNAFVDCQSRNQESGPTGATPPHNCVISVTVNVWLRQQFRHCQSHGVTVRFLRRICCYAAVALLCRK